MNITSNEKMLLTKYDLLYEQRMTRVETTLENVDKSLTEIKEGMREIRSDFRWLFGLMIVFSGSLLGVMAKGFHWY